MNDKLLKVMICYIAMILTVCSICTVLLVRNSSKYEVMDCTTTTEYVSEVVTTTKKVEKPRTTTTVSTTESEPSTESEYITFRASAYCPCEKCCGKYANGITATGVKAKAGRTIAVDPNYIPYGTEVIINGNTYVAEDCGGAIKGNRIDIYFDSHEEALNFGVQYLQGVIV